MNIFMFLYLLVGLSFSGWFVFGCDDDVKADLKNNPVSVYTFVVFLIMFWPAILLASAYFCITDKMDN